MFLDVEKVHAPLDFGVHKRGYGPFFLGYGPFFWLWTIFLVMDHLKKVVTGTFRLFCAFFKASATVRTSSFNIGKLIITPHFLMTTLIDLIDFY